MNECSGASKPHYILVASAKIDVESSATPMVGEMIAMFRASSLKAIMTVYIRFFELPDHQHCSSIVGDLV